MKRSTTLIFALGILALIILLVFVIVRYSQVQCTQEARLCPDGTAVGRVPPSCEFEECPPLNESKIKYISNDIDECARIKYQCEPGFIPFTNEYGCGCMFLEESAEIPCRAEERDVDSCIEQYDPVCGWFDESIRCFAYPCAQTYSNSCFACKEATVKYYTKGECPSPGQ